MKRFMVPFTPREWPLLLHTHKSSLSLMARLDSFSADDDAIVLLLSVCYTRPLLKRLPLLNNCPCLPTSSLLPSRCKRHFSNWRSVPAHLLPCLYICLCGEKKQQKILTKKWKNVIPSALSNSVSKQKMLTILPRILPLQRYDVYSIPWSVCAFDDEKNRFVSWKQKQLCYISFLLNTGHGWAMVMSMRRPTQSATNVWCLIAVVQMHHWLTLCGWTVWLFLFSRRWSPSSLTCIVEMERET